MKLEWQQAPVKTQWGDDMVVASVAIDKDHTVCLYCERDQASKVEAMFAQRKPLTLGQKRRLWSSVDYKPTLRDRVNAYGLAIEAAHDIKENT